MTGTPAIRNLIREGKTEQIQSTLQTSAKDGMFTMEKCLEGLKLKKLVE
jgi:twitching motility protein PilT